MKTSTVLRIAGDVLRERGWYQGFFVGPGGKCCVFGAVNIAATNDACDERLSNGPMETIRTVVQKWPSEWNDSKRRTAAEVMIALDAAYVVALQEEGIEPGDVL